MRNFGHPLCCSLLGMYRIPHETYSISALPTPPTQGNLSRQTAHVQPDNPSSSLRTFSGARNGTAQRDSVGVGQSLLLGSRLNRALSTLGRRSEFLPIRGCKIDSLLLNILGRTRREPVHSTRNLEALNALDALAPQLLLLVGKQFLYKLVNCIELAVRLTKNAVGFEL